MSNPSLSSLPDTVRIGATRFEQSPYYECYANPQTILGVAANRFYPSFNGEDVVATYWTLRRQAVLFDVPEKPWQIEGPGVLPFLEKIFARQIGTLAQGRGRYAIACTSEGGTFMDGILFMMEENRYWYVQPDGALEEWLQAHREDFDVTISDPGSRVLQIQGPNSMQIMTAATNGAIDERMKYFDADHFDIGGQRLFVSRTGWTGELGYEIYSEATTDHKRLWDYLFELGKPQGMIFGSLAAMGIRRIEAGILDNISDFDTSMTPFEVGIGKFIDLDKEGYIGRDALQKADRQTLLLGVKCPAAEPFAGAEILSGSSRVATVTTGACSPQLDCGIGYARFSNQGDWVGQSLAMKTRQGELVNCEIVTLPFYDVDKRIPRGLGKSDS